MFRGIGREEAANALTHGTGVLLSLVGAAVLAYRALWYGNLAHLFAVGVYGLSLVGMFAASTPFHVTISPRRKNIYLWLDHSCIYALIAGTYTPFMVSVLKGAMGTAVLATVWSLAAVGVVSKTILKLRSDLISLPFYFFMGWLIVLVLQPLSSHIAAGGLVLLVAGGLAYWLGIVFFLAKFSYAHAVWHGFVLAGSALHFACILLYARPA